MVRHYDAFSLISSTRTSTSSPLQGVSRISFSMSSMSIGVSEQSLISITALYFFIVLPFVIKTYLYDLVRCEPSQVSTIHGPESVLAHAHDLLRRMMGREPNAHDLDFGSVRLREYESPLEAVKSKAVAEPTLHGLGLVIKLLNLGLKALVA